MTIKNPIGRFVSILCICICVYLCPQVRAEDYDFSVAQSFEFPATDDILMYQIYDMDHDGLDEILALFPKSYYVYSPLYDSILFSDTLEGFPGFSGLLATDWNEDTLTDILILTTHGGLYLQDGAFESVRQLLSTISELSNSGQAANLYNGDLDDDGEADLTIARLGYELRDSYCMSAPLWDEWNRGELWSGHLPGFGRKWFSNNTIGEYARFVDLDADGRVEAVTWGTWWESMWQSNLQGSFCDNVVRSTVQFAITDAFGTILGNSTGSVLKVAAGDINSSTPGDDIIVFKDGDSFEPGIFNPADEYALYCLGMLADTVEVLWARDAESSENYLFWIPSLPGTFCASTTSDQYSLNSGTDGSVIGAVYGLTRGLRTEEGAFFPQWGPDDIQLVQLSGNSVNIMQLLDPTGVDSQDTGSRPTAFGRIHNYPNPFNAGTTIEFSLRRRASVTVEIYNLLGQTVATLLDNQSFPSGSYVINWDGRNSDGQPASSGLYFGILSTPTDRAVHKMLLLK